VRFVGKFYGTVFPDVFLRPALSRLKSLEIYTARALGDARMLAESPHLTGLEELALRDCHLAPADLHALAQASSLPKLTALRLDRAVIRWDLAEALAGARPLLARLRRFEVSHGAQRDAVRALAALPELRVSHLGLTGDYTRADGVTELALCRHLEHVTFLGLARNALHDRDVRALARSPHLGALEELDLSGNLGVTDAGAKALRSSARLPRLKAVALRETGTSAEEKAQWRRRS
jgi:hypothetical protein